MNIRDFFKGKGKTEVKTHPVKNVFFGLQVFFTHDWPIQLYYAGRLKPNRIRTWITEKNYDPKQFAGFLNRANIQNMSVLCTICNESNVDNTHILAGEIFKNHGKAHNLYLGEIINEPNNRLNPFGVLKPERYYPIFVRCFEEIRKYRPDATIFPAGLIGSEKADYPVSKYIRELKKLGIEKYINDQFRPSGWNFHFYTSDWNNADSIIRNVKGMIWVTEFGCSNSEGFQRQRTWYEVAMSKASKLGIQQMFYYGLKYCGDMGSNRDFSLLDNSFKESDMYKYLEEARK